MRAAFLLGLLLLPLGVQAAPSTLEAYNRSVDRSCRTDADCVVKDVHNCCGYAPACVNREAMTNPPLVDALCRGAAMADICGFEPVEACACVDEVCVADR